MEKNYNNTIGEITSYPKDVFNYWWNQDSFLLPHIISKPGIKDTEIVKSHFGENQYFHAMAGSSSSATDTQNKLKEVTNKEIQLYQKFLKEGNKKDAYFHLGIAMHYMTDSYTPGHAKRNKETGEIEIFMDYTKQNQIQHTKYDDLFNEDKDSYDKAIKNCTDMVLESQNGKPFNSDKYYKLSKDAKVGITDEMKIKSIPEIFEHVLKEKLKKIIDIC